MAKKNNNVWYIIGGVVIVVLVLWIIIANVGNNEVTCNSPYIKVGTSCCLDENANNICDNDETTQQEAVSEEPFCGDGICQSNENAPDCADCNANIKIENLQIELVPPSGAFKEFYVSNYEVTQLGDNVMVYPGYDLYGGFSETQCNNKNLMSLLKDNFDCPGGCYFLVDSDKKGKTHDYGFGDGGFQIYDPDSMEEPLCFYVVFHLKPYPESGIGMYGNPSPLATAESQIIML